MRSPQPGRRDWRYRVPALHDQSRARRPLQGGEEVGDGQDPESWPLWGHVRVSGLEGRRRPDFWIGRRRGRDVKSDFASGCFSQGCLAATAVSHPSCRARAEADHEADQDRGRTLWRRSVTSQPRGEDWRGEEGHPCDSREEKEGKREAKERAGNQCQAKRTGQGGAQTEVAGRDAQKAERRRLAERIRRPQGQERWLGRQGWCRREWRRRGVVQTGGWQGSRQGPVWRKQWAQEKRLAKRRWRRSIQEETQNEW